MQDDFGDDPNFYSTFFREYDPVLGRFHAVDPMAGKYAAYSPYNYSFNNPINLNDPSGGDAYWYEQELDSYGRRRYDDYGVFRIPMDREGGAMAEGYMDPSYNNGDSWWSESGSSGTSEDTEKSGIMSVADASRNWLYDHNPANASMRMLPAVFVTGKRGHAQMIVPDWWGHSDLFGDDANSGGVESRAGNEHESEGFDYEKLGSGVTTGMDAVGVSMTKANMLNMVLQGSAIESKAFKAFTHSGTVIGAIAGGAPALYHIFNGNATWRDGVALGFAGLGVASEFFGVGEVWDGTVGLGIAAGSLTYDVWDATHPIKK